MFEWLGRIADGKETHLSHIGEECLKAIKVQISTGELLLNELPNPLEESSVGHVRAILQASRPACEQRNKLAGGGDDDRSGVAAPGEAAGVVLMREDGDLERLDIAGGEVLPPKGHESSERADGGVGAEAALDNVTDAIALQIQGVGIVDLIGGEHASEMKETIFGVLQLRQDIDTFVH